MIRQRHVNRLPGLLRAKEQTVTVEMLVPQPDAISNPETRIAQRENEGAHTGRVVMAERIALRLLVARVHDSPELPVGEHLDAC